MSREANIEIAKAFYKSLEVGDMDAYFGLLAPDAEIHLAGNFPTSGIARGHEGILKLVTDVFATFEPGTTRFGSEYRILVADDEGVSAMAHGYGKTLVGREYKQTYSNVFKIKDGKIVRFYEFLDTAHAEEALYGNDLVTVREPVANPLDFMDEPEI